MATRPEMIGRDISRDAQEPRPEAGEIAPVSMTRAPGFLERPGRQVLDVRSVAQPVSEEVVDTRELLGVHAIPVGLGSHPARQPSGDHLVEAHMCLYTGRSSVCHALTKGQWGNEAAP